MINRKPVLMLAVLGVLSSTIAVAADGMSTGMPMSPEARAAALDTNGDGFIDRGEAAADPRLAAKFDELDTNKDGKLSPEELRRGLARHGHGLPGGGLLAKLDVNKDGRISREEANADPKFAARFDKLDVNKDGFVDKADFKLLAKRHRDEWFAAADTNKDGKLSKAEFDAATAKDGGFPGGFGHGPHDGHHPMSGKPAMPSQP